MTRGYGKVKKARQGKAVVGMSWMWKKREEMKNSETTWFCVNELPTAWQQPYSSRSSCGQKSHKAKERGMSLIQKPQ
jgi:hypothetical protein